MRTDGTPDADLLLAHLEAGLGPWDDAQSVPESALVQELDAEFAILAFGTSSDTTFATYGVSRHLLGEGRTRAQELVVAVPDVDFAVAVLGVVGRSVLERHEAVSAGERHRLTGYGDSMTMGGVMGMPDPCVDPFLASSPPVDFMRLLPITDAEAAYAGDRGWQALFALLDVTDVDLRDLTRGSVV